MSYEDQLGAAKFKADRDALAQAVQGVCENMEEHALGVEGMEDAPVTRWDRDLRAALGGMQEAVEHAMTMDPNAQRLLQEDEDAAKWVREHGGLELLITHEETFKQLMRERDRYRDLYRRSCAASGDLAEWKREVYELCEYIGVNHEDCDGEKEMLEKAYKLLDKRLMPEGYEWPRYEDENPVKLGDYVPHESEPVDFEVVEIAFSEAYGTVLRYEDQRDGNYYNGLSLSDGARVKRPQVLTADGEPLEAGQTVWAIDDAGKDFGEARVVDSLTSDGRFTVRGVLSCITFDPKRYSHQRPVLDADGVLCREGDEVWETGNHRLRQIVSTSYQDPETGEPLILCDGEDAVPFPASWVTHNKPEPPDSWERIEEDATLSPEVYCHANGIDISQKDGTEIFLADTVEPMARDLVRRCKALAGVSE